MTTPDRLRRLLLCWVAVVISAAALSPVAASGGQRLRKDYALIFGTIWDKRGRPVAGAKVTIQPASRKKPRWELISDHNGEFAQRVPPGEGDYVIRMEDTRNTADPMVRRRRYKPGELETTIHIENDERADVSLHLTE